MHPLILNAIGASETYRGKPSQSIQKLMLHACNAGSCKYPKGVQIVHRLPANYHLGILLDGEADLMVGNSIMAVRKSDLILLPSKVARSFVSAGGFSLLWCEFNGAPAESYYEIIRSAHGRRDISSPIPEGIVLHTEHLRSVQMAIESIMETMRSADNVPQISLLITTALTYLCNRSVDSEAPNESIVINREIREILANIGNPPSIPDMARRSNLSEPHFIRAFTRVTGTPPRQYILNARSEHAKHLLTTTVLPIHTIAGIVGYETENGFRSGFKRKNGITPEEYRASTGVIHHHTGPDEGLQHLYNRVVMGNTVNFEQELQKLMQDGLSARKLMETMVNAIELIGDLYSKNEILLSEFLASSTVVKEGINYLRLYIPETGFFGKAIIGSAIGELRDPDNTLIALMLESIGYEIIDLGVNVSTQQFIDSLNREENVQLIVIASITPASLKAAANTLYTLVRELPSSRTAIIAEGSAATSDFAGETGIDAFALNPVLIVREAYNVAANRFILRRRQRTNT